MLHTPDLDKDNLIIIHTLTTPHKMREKGQVNIWRKIKNNYWFSLFLICRPQVLQKNIVFGLCTS